MAEVSFQQGHINKLKKNTDKIRNSPGATLTANPAAEQSNPFAQNKANNIVSQANSNATPDLNTPDPEIKPTGNLLGSNYLDESGIIDRRGENATRALQERLMKKQQMERQAQYESALAGYQNPAQGFQNGSSFSGSVGNLNIPGFGQDQLSNAQRIINIGRQRGLNQQQITIGLMTALAESGLRNVNYGDRDSVGLFQQRTSQGWGSISQIMNPTYSINTFYDALVNSGRGQTPWQIAQSVQRSAFADGSNYRAQYDKAKTIMDYVQQQAQQRRQGGGSGKRNESYNWIQRNNNKYHDYDKAYGAQCVDLYAFYTSGFVGGNPVPVTGGADIWNQYDESAYRRLSRNNRTQMGDVAVFGRSMGGGYGHVGIVVGDNGNGTLRLLQANATSLGPNGNTVISNISKNALLGYLRPNRLIR